ncbi:MAG: hypothetical protein K6A65_08450, partial [Succinivibrionaceae bacterium]|nr:hypothetical protein [Succinivibrionaceae bacterium]
LCASAGRASVTYRDARGCEGSASATLPPCAGLGPLQGDKARERLLRRPGPGLEVKEARLEGDLRQVGLTLGALNALRHEAVGQYLAHCAVRPAGRPFLLPTTLPRHPLGWVDPRLILNEVARSFYSACGALDSPPPDDVARAVLTSRHCVLGAAGCCRRRAGEARPGRYTLRLGGHELLVETDCERCAMRLCPLGAPHG